MPTCYDAHALYSYVSTSGDLHDPVARQRYSERELRALAVTAGRAVMDVCALRDKRRDDNEREWLLRGLEDELSTELRALLCPLQIVGGASVGRIFHLNSIIEDIVTLSAASLPSMVHRVAQGMSNPFHRYAAWQVLSELVNGHGPAELTA